MKAEKIVVAILAALVALCLILVVEWALAEEGTEAWILRRQATDNVLIQKAPGRQPYEYWRIVDNDPPCGAEIRLTGRQEGKWLECVCMYMENEPVGWVHSGFVVHDKPVPCGMVATVTRPVVAKESIGGRDAWECVAGERVKVLYKSDEWSTTIWGMVPTECLDFTRAGAVTQPRRAGWRDWTKRDHLIYAVDW